MISRLIDFALVVLKLLMFKVCGIIGISKIEFFSFSGTERVEQNQKKKKKKKPFKTSSACKSITFQSNSNKSRTFFCLFTENLTLSFPVIRWAGHNTDLPSNINISKTVRVNIAFAK